MQNTEKQFNNDDESENSSSSSGGGTTLPAAGIMSLLNGYLADKQTYAENGLASVMEKGFLAWAKDMNDPEIVKAVESALNIKKTKTL